jgi:hypothetical protein
MELTLTDIKELEAMTLTELERARIRMVESGPCEYRQRKEQELELLYAKLVMLEKTKRREA